MTKQDILDYFRDINYVYNNCNKHDDLSRMLDELVETQPGWIPCSERLPESDDEVFVTDDAGGLAVVGIDWFNSDSDRWYCSQNVTAWMPLPEPYREIKHTCTDCIIKDTDACARGNTEADEVACEDFVDGKEEET